MIQQDELFDRAVLEKAVLSNSEARRLRLGAKLMISVEPPSTVVIGYLKLDGRLLIGDPDKRPTRAKVKDTLHLMLHGHWFDAVLYGTKRVEYRKIKPRWTKRIWERRDFLKTLVLHRGYTATVLSCAINGIDIGPCPYVGWNDDYYRSSFEVKK